MPLAVTSLLPGLPKLASNHQAFYPEACYYDANNIGKTEAPLHIHCFVQSADNKEKTQAAKQPECSLPMIAFKVVHMY